MSKNKKNIPLPVLNFLASGKTQAEIEQEIQYNLIEKIQNKYEQVSLNSIFPNKRILESEDISVPEWAFRPDHWTTTLLHGLDASDIQGSGLEVGVGTGCNIIYLLSDNKKIDQIVGSDIDPKAVNLSIFNVNNCLENQLAKRYHSVYEYGTESKGVNLLESGIIQRLKKLDFIFACIPQVPIPIGQEINEGDNISHYFDPITSKAPKNISIYGLNLNYNLLLEAKEKLESDGKIILNLSGRPGKKVLEELFKECGYRSDVLYSVIVPQHLGTSLIELTKAEKEGIPFEFFSDLDGKHLITVQEAEQRRLNNDGVYHAIYVIQGGLINNGKNK